MRNVIHKFYLIGLLFVLIIASGLYIQYRYFDTFIDESTERAAAMARDTALARIEESMKAQGMLVSHLADYIAIVGPDETMLAKHLSILHEGNPVFTAIYYLKADGTLINSTGWEPPPGLDFKNRPWYRRATGEKSLSYTEAFIDISADRLIMTIAEPVYNSGGALLGVAAGNIEAGTLVDIINSGAGADRYSFIIDGTGNILAHPDLDYQHPDNLLKAADLDPELEGLAAYGEIGVSRHPLDGKDGYLAFGQIAGTGWTMVSFMSDDFHDAVGNRVAFMFMLFLLSSLLLCTLYLLQQQRYFIGPMLRLEQDIARIDSENDLGYRLPMVADDIFADVRKAMNAVLGRKQQLCEDLEREHRTLAGTNSELAAYVKQLRESEQELRMQYELVTASERENTYLSYHDHLTGIYNRRFCEEEIRRLDTNRNLPISIVMGDVNGLKLTNDAFGHEAGDQLLRKAAQAMQAACRSDDIIARWGGDEFVILLPGTQQQEAERITARIRDFCSKERIEALTVSISFGVATKEEPDEDMRKIMQLAEDRMYSAKTIESEGMTDSIVRTIISALHEKNPDEEHHAERVSALCQKMGAAAGLSEPEIARLKAAGLLHDIGKIAVEESILNKPGWFTEEEWKKMRMHSEIGFRILNTVSGLTEVAAFVLSHHERWDGRGYPKGLKGDAIPCPARIIAIAEAYDAMTNKSSYRGALPSETAMLQLLRNAGTQFDPELVPLFIEKVLGRDPAALRP